MTVLLDTATLDADDRLPAVREAMRNTTAPCEVRYDDGPRDVFTLIAAWRIGSVGAWRNEASGMAMIRTPRHARDANSPVRDLFANHTAGLAHDVDAIPQDVTGDAVGSATGDLLRAVLNSVASDPRVARAGYAETQFARIHTYVEQNFRQPDLDATRIARAINMSVRNLYRVCAAHSYSIEQAVTTLRLHGAQKQLAAPSSADLSIATISRAWGFADPAHFTRRFTREFGLPPRDWRVLATDARP